MKVNIHIKKLGKNRPGTEAICYEYPDNMHTVRELLRETVRINLEKFRLGHEDAEIFQVLSKEKIEEQAQAGKIGFGVHYNTAKQDFRKAVENAWQCFEDGIAVLFIDGKKMETLDEEISLMENSELTFIRMTMLAGRMW